MSRVFPANVRLKFAFTSKTQIGFCRILIFFGVIAGAVEKHPKQEKMVKVNWHGFYGKQRSDVLGLPESRSTTCLVCATFIEVALHMYIYILSNAVFSSYFLFKDKHEKL